jgi:tetratricopeptide (TPR) repeat protein
VASLAFAVTQGKPVDPPRGSKKVPRWLQRALRRGLATEPTDRFPTMHALLRELASRDARRRRRIVLAAVGGIAAATTAIVGGQALDEGRRMASCRAQGDAIAEVWNDDARAAVRQALVATALPYAQATADRVMPWLDRASEDWRETRTTACVRAEVRSEWDANDLDRSLWCLDERRLAFGALVAELQDAKHETVVAAVASAAGLPRVAPCLDEALLQRLPAPPADGRDAIEAVRVELSRVDALQATASYESGLALARASLVRAEELAWPPLVASARRRVGLLQQSTGAYDETERSLEQAYFEAAHADAIDDVFENAVTLTQLVGWQLRRQRDGERWWNLAEVARRQLPDDSGLLASKSLNAHALVDLSAGAYEQAAARFEEAIALGEAALGPNHPEVATTLTNLAVVYHNMGSYDEAVALYRRATEIWEIALGPEHPNVAINHNNLAASLLAKGDYDGAAVHFEHALEINIRALGPEHPDVATAWNNLGAVYHERRMYDEAEEHFEHALRIRERALGPDHPDVASTLGNLAVIRRARGQYREAAELNERALRIQEKALGPDHPDVGTTLLNLGLVLERTGDLERAKQLHERGLRILQRALGPDHASIAGSLTSLATVEHALGNDEEAARLLARARAIYERALGPDHLDLAHALVRSAIVALALEQPRDAIAWAERATEIYGAKQASARDVAEARFVLAKALLAGGERARAIALAEQVRDAYRAMGDDRADERAEVDEWLAGR